MSGPRNKYGVNDATNCYRTFNGQRFDHWMSCPSQEQIRSYRQAGIRCRRQGAELYVHTTDHNKAAQIDHSQTVSLEHSMPIATEPKSEMTDLEFVDALKSELNDFYYRLFHLGVGTRFHAFLEWNGVMTEHLKIVEGLLQKGVPAFEQNRHTGDAPAIPSFQIEYLAEKMECIFDGLINVTPVNREARHTLANAPLEVQE